MLVLARRAGEKIIIGKDEMRIITLGYDEKNKQVKLGFEAPKEVMINREEVYEKIKAAEAEAKLKVKEKNKEKGKKQ